MSLMLAVLSTAMLGCGQPQDDTKPVTDNEQPQNNTEPVADSEKLAIPPMTGGAENFSSAGPNLNAQISEAKPDMIAEIPRFAANSPFAEDYKTPIPGKPKNIWARSCLWEKAPDFAVEKWLTEKPDTKGKFLLIEFWATWCIQCRRSVPLLNQLHEKYKDRLVVIGVSDEEEQIVRKFAENKIEHSVAIDTKARMKEELAVIGIPHIIIVEPGGFVVWEGFPLLKGHELTDELVGKILAAGEKAAPDN